MPSRKSKSKSPHAWVIIAAILIVLAAGGAWLGQSYLGAQVYRAQNTNLSDSDARVQTNLQRLGELAQIHYNANAASFTGFDTCVNSSSPATSTACKGRIGTEVTSLKSNINSASPNRQALRVAASGQNFCLSSNLSSSTSEYFCTDARGTMNRGTGICGPNPSCPYASVVATPTPSSAAVQSWQNPRNRFDVNDDGLVTSNDVLRLTNTYNSKGVRDLVKTNEPLPPPNYIDVNGDKWFTVADVQAVQGCIRKGGKNC